MIKPCLTGVGIGLLLASLIFGCFLLALWVMHNDANYQFLCYVWLVVELLQLLVGLGLCVWGLLS